MAQWKHLMMYYCQWPMIICGDQGFLQQPENARRIMRLNPDNDTLSSVGDDLGGSREFKYRGTEVGKDDCVYGIPPDRAFAL
jgi:hypothetical protein